MSLFERLPEELWLQIMSELSWVDIFSLRCLDANFGRLHQDKLLDNVPLISEHITLPYKLTTENFSICIKDNSLELTNLQIVEDILPRKWPIGENEIKHLKIATGSVGKMDKFVARFPETLTDLELLDCEFPTGFLWHISKMLPSRMHRDLEPRQRPKLSHVRMANSQKVLRHSFNDVYSMYFYTPRPLVLTVHDSECGKVQLTKTWQHMNSHDTSWLSAVSFRDMTGLEWREEDGGWRMKIITKCGEENEESDEDPRTQEEDEESDEESRLQHLSTWAWASCACL